MRVTLPDKVLWIPAEVISALSCTVKRTLYPFLSRTEFHFHCPDKTFAKIFWYLKDGADLFNHPYPKEDTEAELRLDCSLYCYGRAMGWTELSDLSQGRICNFAQTGKTDDKTFFMFVKGKLGVPLQAPFPALDMNLKSPARPGFAHTMIEDGEAEEVIRGFPLDGESKGGA